MENRNVEEIIWMRAEKRISQKQGIEFLREYREHPERFQPLIDHQYRHFDEWADEDSRNMCWDVGIFQDNCPYFTECWKIFTTTVMTVFVSVKGVSWEPNTVNILVEFIRNGLIAGLSSAEQVHIETARFTDGMNNEFVSFNLVLGKDEEGQFITWGRGHTGCEELNVFNGQND